MRAHASRSHTSRTRWWPGLLAVVALALLIGAGPATAAPPLTLGLDGLRAELTAHGSLDGFMRTTMSGTTPEDIPVTILAVVDGSSWGKLIMFESADPVIAGGGGIAAGMSGSPIFVNVDGADRIVGAVSYGDAFTLRGTGLATPIEDMTALQSSSALGASAPAPATLRLDRPVATSSGVVRRLVLDDDAVPPAAAAGTSVMHPLALASISGLPAGSKAYQKLASRLQESGLTVVPGGVAAASASTPDLEPGSPCGVVFSSGDLVLSVLGTVTYVDGDTALLFGHPILSGYSGFLLGMGPIEGTLTGAEVQGVWPSSSTPYKLMSAADAKGVATRDASAGVVARLGGTTPPHFPVTTHVSVGGKPVRDDRTDLGQWFATEYYPEIAAGWDYAPGVTTLIAAAGLYHGLASDPLVGSAATTTTVVVSDGARDFTVVRDNIWDNNGDLTGMGLGDVAAGDVTMMVARLLSDPYGTRGVTVRSVDVAADFSSSSRRAGITDATTPRALRAGRNEVVVTYYRFGSGQQQTLTAELDIPAGTRLTGTLDVMSATTWNEYFGTGFGDVVPVPQTVAGTVDEIAAMPGNGEVVVAFFPDSPEEEASGEPRPAAKTAVAGGWVFSGGVEKETAAVDLRVSPATVSQNVPLIVSGELSGSGESVPVSIYLQEAGREEPTKPAVTVRSKQRFGASSFSALLPGARHNVLVTAEVGALSADSLPGADQVLVKVRAKTRLSVTRRGGRLDLTARVTPADTGGRVVFQRLARGRWVSAGSAQLEAGLARVTTSRSAGVRARFTGGPLNAASGWATVTVR